MLDRKALQALGCWTGYRLERVEWPQGDGRTLSLYLKPVSKVMNCAQCGARCQQIHETTVRRVRDLPLFEYRVVLRSSSPGLVRTLRRPAAGELDWLGRYQRVTERFAKACETAAGRQCPGGSGLLRPGLAYGQIDRQDALASTGGRAGLVDDPVSGNGRIRAAQRPSLRHGGRRSDWAAGTLGRPRTLTRNGSSLLRTTARRRCRAH